MKVHTVSLVDPEADGVISFAWDDVHSGISVQVEDIFGHVVNADFYKKDLVKKLKKLIKKLEQE